MKHVFIINKSNTSNYEEVYKLLDTKLKEYGIDYQIVLVQSKYALKTSAIYYNDSNTIIYPVGKDENINLLIEYNQKNNMKLGIMPIGCASELYEKISKSGKYKNIVDVKTINGIPTLNTVTLGLNNIFSKEFNVTIDANDFFYDYEMVSGIVISEDIKLLMNYNLLDKYKYLKSKEYNDSKVIQMNNATKYDIYSNSIIQTNINGDAIQDKSFGINTKSSSVQIIDNHQLTRNLVK